MTKFCLKINTIYKTETYCYQNRQTELHHRAEADRLLKSEVLSHTHNYVCTQIFISARKQGNSLDN